jgi:hypothetical protein
MLIGRFGHTSGRPYFESRVVLPHLKVAGNVSFLFDTGADKSLLMPLDAQRCGIDYNVLQRTEPTTGVGGQMECYVESALVAFADSDELCIYSIEIGISPAAPEIMRLPSLLGRDVIDRWRVLYDKPNTTLTAEVIAADSRVPLRNIEQPSPPSRT